MRRGPFLYGVDDFRRQPGLGRDDFRRQPGVVGLVRWTVVLAGNGDQVAVRVRDRLSHQDCPGTGGSPEAELAAEVGEDVAVLRLIVEPDDPHVGDQLGPGIAFGENAPITDDVVELLDRRLHSPHDEHPRASTETGATGQRGLAANQPLESADASEKQFELRAEHSESDDILCRGHCGRHCDALSPQVEVWDEY